MGPRAGDIQNGYNDIHVIFYDNNEKKEEGKNAQRTEK